MTIRLAESFGFCWGVERAIRHGLRSKRTFSQREKFGITNEIIHNPTVNQRLQEMNVGFIEASDGEKDFARS